LALSSTDSMADESNFDIPAILRNAFPPELLVPKLILGPNRTATYFSGNEHAKSFDNLLAGKTWLSVDVESLDAEHDILFFLPPVGFAHLLPALMLAATTHFQQFSRLAELLSTLLTRAPDNPQEFEQRISTLNLEQQDAVGKSLELLETRFADSWQSNPARVALNSFWRKANKRRST
jgi:hypothetical protein